MGMARVCSTRWQNRSMPIPASPPIPLDLPPELRQRLGRARRLVAFTGAGISKESGLDTFRDLDGVWQRVRPEDMATLDAFRRRPAVVWSWYAERYARAAAVLPNPAHLALER